MPLIMRAAHFCPICFSLTNLSFSFPLQRSCSSKGSQPSEGLGFDVREHVIEGNPFDGIKSCGSKSQVEEARERG
ncbi:hypothetical protein LINPERHAP1_LOCUS30158 [Linum perenne]